MVSKKLKKRKVRGSASRPRLSIYRSLRGLNAQFINDDAGITVLGITSFNREFKKQLNGKHNVEAAKAFGDFIGKVATAKGIKQVVFDRGSFKYHGKIKALADAARGAGLDF